MRAIFHSELSHCSEIKIEGDAFAHLKVVRLREKEKLLLLDGLGGAAICHLREMSKRHAIVEVEDFKREEFSETFDLAIGLVKKDAMDLCLKMAVELGARRIFFIESKFSQRYEMNYERAERLLVQAIEQSNSLWMPKLMPLCSWSQLIENAINYEQVLVMGMTQSQEPTKLPQLSRSILGVIGPEGGFDTSEEEELVGLENAFGIHLPTPILRTPTALAALGGVIFTKL